MGHQKGTNMTTEELIQFRNKFRRGNYPYIKKHLAGGGKVGCYYCCKIHTRVDKERTGCNTCICKCGIDSILPFIDGLTEDDLHILHNMYFGISIDGDGIKRRDYQYIKDQRGTWRIVRYPNPPPIDDTRVKSHI